MALIEYGCTVNSVERDALRESIDLRMAAGGISTLQIAFDSEEGTYRPEIDQAVILLADEVPKFKGFITAANETTWLGPPTNSIVTQCTVQSQEILAQYRYVTETIPAGSTLKQALQQIEPYFTGYGLSLAAGQVNGPTLTTDVTFTRTRGDEVFARLMELTGYLWEFNADDEIEMYAPGSRASPGNLLDSGPVHQVGDVTIEPTRNKTYANRIILIVTGAGPKTSTEIFTAADGVTSGGFIYFTTKYPASQSQEDAWPNRFIFNGTPLGPVGFIGISETGAWDWDPVNHRLRYTIASGVTFPAGADEITVEYAIGYPFEVIVEDVPAQAPPVGVRELILTMSEAMSLDEATAYAQALLDRKTLIRKIAKFDSHTADWFPGQTVTINLAKRNTNADYLITDVVMRPEVGGAPFMRWQITAVEGVVSQGNWRETPKAWLGGGSASSGGVSQTGGTVTKFFDYAQHVVVAKSGGDFDTIQAAIDSISDASSSKRYLVLVMPGKYAEQVTMKSWVDVRGVCRRTVQIEHGATDGAVKLSDFCQIEDLLIENSSTEGHWGIVGDNVSHWHIRNVDLLAPFGSSKRGAGIKVTGTSWGTGFIEQCVINTYTQTNQGIYLDSDGVDLADVTINDVFVDSFEATTGGGILLDNVIDTQLRDVYARTSSAGYDVRVTGASVITMTNSWLEFGTTSLEVDTGASVELAFNVIDSIGGSGSWAGVTWDRDSEFFEVTTGGVVGVSLDPEGVIRMKEYAGPPATPADTGAFWIKSDGAPWFTDGAGISSPLIDDGPAGHVHGLQRVLGDGATTVFNLLDVAEYLEHVSINGAILDPSLLTLSDDRTQVTFNTAPTDEHVIALEYVIASQ